MYPSPPDITNIEWGFSESDTFSIVGASGGALVAAERPPEPTDTRKH